MKYKIESKSELIFQSWIFFALNVFKSKVVVEVKHCSGQTIRQQKIGVTWRKMRSHTDSITVVPLLYSGLEWVQRS